MPSIDAMTRERIISSTSPSQRTTSTVMPRVLVVGHHIFPDTFEWHIAETFRRMGHVTEFFESAVRMGPMPYKAQQALKKLNQAFLREPERLFERRMLRAVQRFQPQLILVTLGSQLSPKTVQRLRGVTTARIVCWCQDQMTTLGRQYILGSEYDAVFVKDRHLQDLFSRMIKSTPFFYLPEACNPQVHRSVALSAEDEKRYGCDVMIAGTLYYYRQEILQRLAGVDLKVWGLQPGWLLSRLKRRSLPPVFMEEKARAAKAARICLNTLHYGEVNGLNARAFEIAGCGGFQLITSVPVLAEHFDIDQEVAAFNSIDELLEKVRYYLDHPQLAAAIAARGQLRAHRDHTYENRLRSILRITFSATEATPLVPSPMP
jgi:spore maturation protein CgeB